MGGSGLLVSTKKRKKKGQKIKKMNRKRTVDGDLEDLRYKIQNTLLTQLLLSQYKQLSGDVSPVLA